MADPFYSLAWREQQDRSVAADFLERVAEDGGTVSQDAQGLWWISRIPTDLRELYGVTLRAGSPAGALKTTRDFRPAGTVQGRGERLTLTPRESDIWLAAAFLLDRVEGVSLAADGTMLLDSPYAGGSTARARNFAEQFGLTVTLNDDPRLRPKWELRRPRLGVMDAPLGATEALDRYRAPWMKVAEPHKREVDTVIVSRAAPAVPFRNEGGKVIVVDSSYGLTPATAKVLLREVYLGSAHAV